MFLCPKPLIKMYILFGQCGHIGQVGFLKVVISFSGMFLNFSFINTKVVFLNDKFIIS